MSVNIRSRYHVNDERSFRESASNRRDAFRIASAIATREHTAIMVYDSMARRGCAELWTLHPGATYSVLFPTRVRARE